MRWVAVLAACSAPVAAPPSNVGGRRPERAPEEPPAVEDCAARTEDWAAGNHDRYRFEDPLTNQYGYRDGKGVEVIAARFRFAYEFGPGGVAAAIDGVTPFVFIGVDGAVIANALGVDNGPDYFQEGVARIVDPSRKIGFMSDRGKITIAPRFDEAESFCHGKALVRLGSESLWIDKQGNRTAPPAN